MQLSSSRLSWLRLSLVVFAHLSQHRCSKAMNLVGTRAAPRIGRVYRLHPETYRTIMDLGVWLRSLGLERYEPVFRENEIDDTVLTSLTAEDLKELGIGPLGHRRKLLDAIALLRSETATRSSPPEASSALSRPPQDSAERRQVTVMFSDLVGSTALSARMDPEDLREVISAYQKCVAQVVHVNWLWPQPQRTLPTSSRRCRAHLQRHASRRVTVSRSHAPRLRRH
jgi:hypothetical protein